MKKIAIIAPCILPVPAVKGGAVEELITCILNQNEISKKYVIDLYTVACSSYNDISYSYTNIIPISQIRFSKNPFDKYVTSGFQMKTDTKEYNLAMKNSENRDKFIHLIKKIK